MPADQSSRADGGKGNRRNNARPHMRLCKKRPHVQSDNGDDCTSDKQITDDNFGKLFIRINASD
jgi:hypothetical protein